MQDQINTIEWSSLSLLAVEGNLDVSPAAGTWPSAVQTVRALAQTDKKKWAY
jgi:hypothetical protein